MAADPYSRGLFDHNPYAESSPVEGRLVAVLDASLSGRGLNLIKPISRALRRYDVHELIITDEDAGPGSTVQGVWYAGFFEVLEGGMAIVGSQIQVGGVYLGEIVGFDETHMPNHLNIVLHAAQPATGVQLNLQLGQLVTIGGRTHLTESEQSSWRRTRIWSIW